MEKKVYIVTAGTYSDYHIKRVFSTREKAQEYLDHIGNDDNESIEEYNLDKETPRRVFKYHVRLFADREPIVNEIYFNDEPDYRKNALKWCLADICSPISIWFNIEAKDAPHAVKIASERLAQIKATPYLFPLLKTKCACDKYSKRTPIYDFNTKEILLYNGERIELPQDKKGGLF